MRYFLLLYVFCVVAVMVIAGKRGSTSRRPPIEIFSDMDRQPKLRPQTVNAFFRDGMSSQPHPAGTIPQTQPILVGDREVYPFEDSPVTTGLVTGTTNFIELNPFPITAQLLARGQHNFQISCAPCHSALGDGNGVPKKIGAMAVVGNLHDKRIVELTDGEVFHIISHGKGLMQGYAANIGISDRWAVVAYLRALQLSRLASTNDVPESARAGLLK